MKPTKYIFSLLLLFGVTHNAYAVENSPQIRQLLNQKQAKIEELEKCDSKRKGFMIAGISTIGLTAVGVGVNIAQANKSGQLSEQIAAQNAELKQQQDKISTINKEISQHSATQQRTTCESDGLHVYANGVCHDKAQYECTQLGKLWENGTCKDRPVSSQPVNTAPTTQIDNPSNNSSSNTTPTNTVTNTPANNNNTPTSTITTTTTTNGNHITSTVTTTTYTTTTNAGSSACNLNFDLLADNLKIGVPVDISGCTGVSLRPLEVACSRFRNIHILKSDNKNVEHMATEASHEGNSFVCRETSRRVYEYSAMHGESDPVDRWWAARDPGAGTCASECNSIRSLQTETEYFLNNPQCLMQCARKIKTECEKAKPGSTAMYTKLPSERFKYWCRNY